MKQKHIHFTSNMEGDLKVAKKIHFMGIGGSGISGVAVMAQKNGFKVTGCDLERDTDYLDKVRKSDIKVEYGHSQTHLKNVDYLVVSPAILFQNSDNQEVVEAKKNNKLLTWEEFLGKFLQKDMQVICISGTHGKSTTTALAALLFAKSDKDPSVMLGAKIKDWEANFRVGESKLFIAEADEFNDNFLNYSPNAIVLNNIEFDHPDYFKSYNEVLESFSKFVNRLSGRKILVVNQDSKGVSDLFNKLGSDFVNSLDTFGYTFSDKPLVNVKNSFKIDILARDSEGTLFSLDSVQYRLNIPGEYNVANSAGVVILAKQFGISDETAKETIKEFKGIGRRLELIGENKDIKVYDDYAHHPTAIKATIEALRQKYPNNRIWVVNEPHSFSRTKALLSEYKGVFDKADKVIIGPIFKARDKETFNVSELNIVQLSEHKDIIALNNIDAIVKKILSDVKPDDIILVMGAGKSYLWARELLNRL